MRRWWCRCSSIIIAPPVNRRPRTATRPPAEALNRGVNRGRQKPRAEEYGGAYARPNKSFFRFRELGFVSLRGEKKKAGPDDEKGGDRDADFDDDGEDGLDELREGVESATEGVVVLCDGRKKHDWREHQEAYENSAPIFHILSFYTTARCTQRKTIVKVQP